MTQSTAAPHCTGSSWGRGADSVFPQEGRGAASPLSRPAPRAPGPRRPQPAPPLAPVPGKSRPARGGHGLCQPGPCGVRCCRWRVRPAGWASGARGEPAERLRDLQRPRAVPGSPSIPSARQSARARELRPSWVARAALLAPLLVREGPRRESGGRPAVLGAGAGESGLRRARPSECSPGWGARGRAGRDSGAGTRRAPAGSPGHGWSVRGRAAPLCKSVLQRFTDHS